MTIPSNLSTLFTDDRRWKHDGRRVIFWYDPSKEFQQEFDALDLPKVRKWQVKDNFFTTKNELFAHADEDFLLYLPFPEPAARENWLLDVQKSGLTFSADRAGLLFTALGLHDKNLQDVLRRQVRFFDSKTRKERLLALNIEPSINEQNLLLSMMCVLTDLKVRDEQLLIRKVLSAGLSEDSNELWSRLQKHGLEEAFWEQVRLTLGYQNKTVSLRRLMVSLLATHLQNGWTTAPAEISFFGIQPAHRAVVFMDQWKQHNQDSALWQTFSDQLSEDLDVKKYLKGVDPRNYQQADTFRALDLQILQEAALGLTGTAPDFRKWSELLTGRSSSIWFEDYRAAYLALLAAVDFFQSLHGLPKTYPDQPEVLFQQYTEKYHRVDRAYRTFVEHFQQAELEELKPLSAAIENFYTNRFLAELGSRWSDVFGADVSKKLGFKMQQWSFFKSHVEPLLSDRVFVLISDALRYEIATELSEEISRELRGTVNLQAALSTLPSKTHWGMAALLPGETLSVDEKGSVLRDGKSTEGLDARIKVLQASGVEATAFKLPELLNTPTEEMRNRIKPYRLIYVYHDVIDATGDHASSESGTFKAAREAIGDLLKAIKRLVNSLNAQKVLVTADHGFQYQRRPIEASDKLQLPKVPGVFETDRRYVLSSTPLQLESGNVEVDLNAYQKVTGVQYYSPRGHLRYSISGSGVQYVHGGMSLQEMVVPILSYQHQRATKGDGGVSRKVKALITSTDRTVRNNTFTVMVVQEEPVTDKIRPRRVRIGLYEKEGRVAVTNEVLLDLASESTYATEREFPVKLIIGSRKTSSNTLYLLEVRDAEDDTVVTSEEWRVNILFSNDFDAF
ncbi:BREX-1 system phosphatase PglZ type A [Deinococcus roseus]|uniref:DNA repair protein n=1 Tax=Deinococcus roseus TaxID=392414 RepID=A0ABQ2DE99_9DEIO|nr:BREX-1 system phosphatase PglZ type A [Deinococcus roseus]GGJ55095.1 DNA repair protein [Deinococcus roseus]